MIVLSDCHIARAGGNLTCYETLGVPYLIVRAGSDVAQEAPNNDYLRLRPIATREAAKFSLHLLSYL
jgi:nucleoside phosphorylase